MWCIIQAASFIFPHIYGLDLHGGLQFVNFRLKLYLFWWSLQFPTKGDEHCPSDASSLFLRSLIICPALYYYNLYICLTFHVDLWISKTEVMGDISLLSLDGFLEENSKAETVCILLTAAPWTRIVRYDMKALRVKKKKTNWERTWVHSLTGLSETSSWLSQPCVFHCGGCLSSSAQKNLYLLNTVTLDSY